MQVLVRDNNVDQALRVLKKKMQREGILRELKERRAYEKPSEKRVREKGEAIRRARKDAAEAEEEGCSRTVENPGRFRTGDIFCRLTCGPKLSGLDRSRQTAGSKAFRRFFIGRTTSPLGCLTLLPCASGPLGCAFLHPARSCVIFDVYGNVKVG